MSPAVSHTSAPASAALPAEIRETLFSGAHTTHRYTADPVDAATIQQVYEDLRWAPTAMNTQPLRLTVLAGETARGSVIDHLSESNRDKTRAAPLTVVAAFDPAWHEHMETLAPHRAGMRESFADPARSEARLELGRFNGLLQLGYLILGLRAHGLQVGPMTGLDADGVDSAVHSETGWRTLAVLNVGHAPDPEDPQAQRPRAGRLEFSQAAQVL
ncbi:malonic semialdehyde reductase [Bogoriella caseilytica]|uniref:3-hydroxypropanoate dehydrogenase n=1 Tax=Bogoriella caseilytica TaxID=56055 RepID=A0A3N2BEC3_9MICO|nr:malonic semialdehyde reductase [Bogoriella caseilytica]ROR73589.1 3-hydroxypropanoate dehydrogenase [Bogoriella caseilytica]